MERRRKCLIGVVAFKGVESPILQNYMAWTFHLGRRMPEWDFMLRVIGKKEQYRARNNLAAMAKVWCPSPDDILLYVDDDMVLPQNTFERLINVVDNYPDVGVVGGLYWQRGGTYRPVIQKILYRDDALSLEWYQPHEITGEVMEVGIVGGGVLMFPMKSIQSMMPPLFWVDGVVGTDIAVCARLNQAGFKVYCDTGLEFGHLDEGRVLTHKNLPSQFVRYSAFTKRVREEVCEYLRMDPRDLEDSFLANYWALENNWKAAPRETFDQVSDAYTGIGNIAVERGIHYAINSGVDGFADLVDSIDRGLFRKSNPALDYGCGIGIAAELLAESGFEVDAMDLKDSAVLKFMEWRIARHPEYSGKVNILPVDSEMPKFRDKYSVVVMLDIIEHLMNPREILHEIFTRIEPGGHFHTNFAVMDFKGADEGVPQHVKLITVNEFEQIAVEYGLRAIGTFLWQKEK